MLVGGIKITDEENIQFAQDMQQAGLEIEYYHGRFWWEGVACRVDDLQDALSNTKVPCQWDNMGLGWIVYPKARNIPS